MPTDARISVERRHRLPAAVAFPEPPAPATHVPSFSRKDLAPGEVVCLRCDQIITLHDWITGARCPGQARMTPGNPAGPGPRPANDGGRSRRSMDPAAVRPPFGPAFWPTPAPGSSARREWGRALGFLVLLTVAALAALLYEP